MAPHLQGGGGARQQNATVAAQRKMKPNKDGSTIINRADDLR